MIKGILQRVAVALIASRSFAGDPQMPSTAQIASCSADPVVRTAPGYFTNRSVSCADVNELLSKAHVVSERQWLQEYSHVAFGDRTGRLNLRDGTVLRWMMRPGGLAYLEFENGRKMYLVSCCSKQPSNNTLDQGRGQ